jgi:hypothetical protein
MMSTTSYRVHFQDFRPWTPFVDQKMPEVQTFDFDSFEDAQVFHSSLPKDERCVATITQIPPPKARKRQLAPELCGGGMCVVGRKLTL